MRCGRELVDSRPLDGTTWLAALPAWVLLPVAVSMLAAVLRACPREAVSLVCPPEPAAVELSPASVRPRAALPVPAASSASALPCFG